MVGGTDFNARPFNLATNGHRQPGSAIKPFILARALDDGVDPNSVWASQPVSLPFVNGHGQKGTFDVSQLRRLLLRVVVALVRHRALGQLGVRRGGHEGRERSKVARLAQRMGIRTKLSTNPAMMLGGLKEGVTPLEMAYAYSTIANDGKRVSGSHGAGRRPARWRSRASRTATAASTDNKPNSVQVLPPKVGAGGEGDAPPGRERAAPARPRRSATEDIWGKTGTTENYGDAWFVGGNADLTVAVWVGYADKLQPMETEHGGSPVAGGTFPAEIFHDFMTSWLELRQARRLERAANKQSEDGTSTDVAAGGAGVADRGAAGHDRRRPTPTTGGTDGGGGTAAAAEARRRRPADAAAEPAARRAAIHARSARDPAAHGRRRRRRAARGGTRLARRLARIAAGQGRDT